MSPERWDRVPGSPREVQSRIADLEARGRQARRQRYERSLWWLVASLVLVALMWLLLGGDVR